jgi:hypothetical protein
MPSTSTSLDSLGALLRDAETVISPRVRDSDAEPALGELAAAGPRAAGAPDEYVLLVEAIREGYLLHYGEPRLIAGADPDLSLLAGDYLYALGLERLANRGDLVAVAELADLISLCAQLHAEVGERNGSEPAEPHQVRALWLASAVAVGVGPSEAHEEGKLAARRGDPGAVEAISAAAAATAESAGIGGALARAAESIGFAQKDLSDRA